MTEVQIAVTFMDDSERFFQVPADEGWTITTERGLTRLTIGRGVPRVSVPLGNVKYWEVLPRTVPGGRPRVREDVAAAVEWAETCDADRLPKVGDRVRFYLPDDGATTDEVQVEDIRSDVGGTKWWVLRSLIGRPSTVCPASYWLSSSGWEVAEPFRWWTPDMRPAVRCADQTQTKVAGDRPVTLDCGLMAGHAGLHRLKPAEGDVLTYSWNSKVQS